MLLLANLSDGKVGFGGLHHVGIGGFFDSLGAIYHGLCHLLRLGLRNGLDAVDDPLQVDVNGFDAVVLAEIIAVHAAGDEPIRRWTKQSDSSL
jgi:hypothetical protein